MTDDKERVAEYMASVRDAAERYLELGWSIIPILPDTKVPAIPWTQYQERPPDEDTVASWFEHGVPDGSGGTTTFFGIGVITGAVSGLVVLDCDNPDALAYALGEAGLWSPLGTRTTRGQHLYFRHPGGRVSNKAGGIGIDWPDVPGLDLRGDGGYVVAPPTIKFDKEGRFQHRYAFTVSDAELLDAKFGMPTWAGIKPRATDARPDDGEFSIESLRLDDVRSYGASVWDDAGKRVAALGHKMRDGDGRNAWLTRYVGECVGTGMEASELPAAAELFASEFFEQPLPERETKTTIASVVAIDKRNHPERYAPPPAPPTEGPAAHAGPSALRLITSASLPELRKRSAGVPFLIDPYIQPQSIVQVVGFNGHGKSRFLLNLLWSASLGKDFGPATVVAPLRALYLDHESSEPTLCQRLDECERLLGQMASGMTVWAKSISSLRLDFTNPGGLANLEALLREVKPQIVVVDTVREAWQGMEENSPHAWLQVNQLAIACRNAGMSVVLVHHRNKPNQQGIGREAGSTAQLKDLDTQIFVTKVVEDGDQARREAALSDSSTQVADFGGTVRTAFQYLRALLPSGYALRAVFEVTFGKVRSSTENHAPAFIGFAQNLTTGEGLVVSSKTPRQKAVTLHEKGRAPALIADALQVPLPVVERWISSKGDSNA